MTQPRLIEGKIITAAELDAVMSAPRRPVVFTNGCFDILHRGHTDYLDRASRLGKSLVVGVNSNNSVKRQNKGSERPINTLEDRMAVLAALESVDFVIAFDDDTPLKLIEQIKPDVLVKGGDWAVEDIVGNEIVWSYHGQVKSIAFRYNRSTSRLIAKIRNI